MGTGAGPQPVFRRIAWQRTALARRKSRVLRPLPDRFGEGCPGIATLRLICLGLLFAYSSCASGPFRVKPAGSVAIPGPANRVRSGSLEAGATALLDEDFLISTFDANLVMAGILPVMLEIKNAGSSPLDVAHFDAVLAAGQLRRRALQPRNAFKKLLSYYQIRAYSRAGHDISLRDFSSYAIDTTRPLEPGGMRAGILFFSVPTDAIRGGRLVLNLEPRHKTPDLGEAAITLRAD